MNTLKIKTLLAVAVLGLCVPHVEADLWVEPAVAEGTPDGEAAILDVATDSSAEESTDPPQIKRPIHPQ